uniref:Putative ovule protein n=1 Tax=Solanum chacoense TaxID=4108 RepID=A0A0V0H3V5_SOLCH
METFSPRHKKKDFDPFVTALQKQSRTEKPQQNSSNLSPLKVSDLLFDHESNQENTKKFASVSSSSSSSSSSFVFFSFFNDLTLVKKMKNQRLVAIPKFFRRLTK